MKHKRDDGPEKQEDEAVDVTPVMICVFVVMCCFMLVLLYYFYDRLGMPPAQTARAPPTSQSPAHQPEPLTLQGPALSEQNQVQEPRGHSVPLDFLPFLPLAVPGALLA